MAVPMMLLSAIAGDVDELFIDDKPFVPHFHCKENWIEVLGAT